jgi:lipopolysaccharide heptosyltransferase I
LSCKSAIIGVCNRRIITSFSMRLLIVKLSSIGDVVHTLPAAATLRRGLPDAHIAWAVERRASTILKDSPIIDDLIEIDSKAWRKHWHSNGTLSDISSTLRSLRGSSPGGAQKPDRPGTRLTFDVAVDFQGLIKSGLLALASSAPRRIGFETSELREGASRLFLTEQVETSQFKHVIDKNLALAQRVLADYSRHSQEESFAGACATPGKIAAEDTTHTFEFPISVTSEDEEFAEQAVGGWKSPFAIINPGGGWSTKLWAPARYGHVADWLNRECGMKSIVTFGPGEEPLAHSVAIASRSGGATPLASTLKQFVALARRAELFIGGDTGPLHLAAACGTPIVGIYGPTAPERNGPFDPSDVTVGRDLWCRPDCHRRSCWHWECMEISVGDIEKAITRRLAIARKSLNTENPICTVT